jgi:hypothetical protein
VTTVPDLSTLAEDVAEATTAPDPLAAGLLTILSAYKAEHYAVIPVPDLVEILDLLNRIGNEVELNPDFYDAEVIDRWVRGYLSRLDGPFPRNTRQPTLAEKTAIAHEIVARGGAVNAIGLLLHIRSSDARKLLERPDPRRTTQHAALDEEPAQAGGQP